jgi:hypothetical protein
MPCLSQALPGYAMRRLSVALLRHALPQPCIALLRIAFALPGYAMRAFALLGLAMPLLRCALLCLCCAAPYFASPDLASARLCRATP